VGVPIRDHQGGYYRTRYVYPYPVSPISPRVIPGVRHHRVRHPPHHIATGYIALPYHVGYLPVTTGLCVYPTHGITHHTHTYPVPSTAPPPGTPAGTPALSHAPGTLYPGTRPSPPGTPPGTLPGTPRGTHPPTRHQVPVRHQVPALSRGTPPPGYAPGYAPPWYAPGTPLVPRYPRPTPPPGTPPPGTPALHHTRYLYPTPPPGTPLPYQGYQSIAGGSTAHPASVSSGFVFN